MPNDSTPDTTSETVSNTAEQVIDKDQIKQLCGEAYKAYDQLDHKGALRVFYQAWLKLPKPQHDHLESSWVLTGIGDCYFKLRQFQQAIEALSSALHCPSGDQSAFIHLRLGQCLLDIGETGSARRSLFKAFQLGGLKAFEQEPPKYPEAIKDLTAAG